MLVDELDAELVWPPTRHHWVRVDERSTMVPSPSSEDSPAARSRRSTPPLADCG
jgi:hypothetical protein